MTKVKRIKIETEAEELNRLYKGKSYTIETDTSGTIKQLVSDNSEILAWASSKGIN